MTQEELQQVLERHRLWLANNTQGEQADLSGLNLRRAKLRQVDLSKANLKRNGLQGSGLLGAKFARGRSHFSETQRR